MFFTMVKPSPSTQARLPKHIPTYWHVLVALYVLVLLGLGVRTMITHDNRFGWAMFSHGVAYELEYSWLYADGNELPYRTGDELKGKARKRLIDMKNNHTFYGVGAVREWTKAYVRYMYEENRPTGAKAFVARLQHRINKRPAAPAEIFTYPRTNLE